MVPILEKQDKLPQVQARLSVIQPKILMNLSSINFSLYFPFPSIVNPALLNSLTHSLTHSLTSVTRTIFQCFISTATMGAVCSRKKYA
jgi:hypothetical protein